MFLKTVLYLCSEDTAFPNVLKFLEMKGAIVTILYFYYSRNEVTAESKVNCASFYAINAKSRPWHR